MIDCEPGLLSHDELSAWGYRAPQRRAAVERGVIAPIRRGVFALAEDWATATREARTVATARALTRTISSRPVFSHETAAAILGLPLLPGTVVRLHAIVPVERPGAPAGLIRHRGTLGPDEIVEVGGLLCTSLVRTVADLARTASLEAAMVVADAATRRLANPRRDEYDEQRAAEFREEVLDAARRSAHGVTRAERVMAGTDGRSESAGETISGIRLRALRFRAIRRQVPVPGPPGRGDYALDFGLDDVPALAEFDGRIKYIDGRFTIDRTADEIFDREKQREDWIRGVTGLPLVRWGWPHLATPATLGARLAAFGVHPPR